MIKSHSGKVLEHASPSQITTFSSCERKWHWDKVEGYKSPSTPATELGTKVHAHCEHYELTGEIPPSDQAGMIALPGLMHLPDPQTEGMGIEHPLLILSGSNSPHAAHTQNRENLVLERPSGGRVEIPADALLIGQAAKGIGQATKETGKITQIGGRDVRLDQVLTATHPDLLMDIFGFMDLWIPRLRFGLDHKTTSNFRYVKTKEQLRADAQAIIYSWFNLYAARLRNDEGDVVFKHVYYRTKGTACSTTSEVTFSPNELDERFQLQVVDVVARMVKAAVLPIKQVTPNVAACRDFGGCPHFGRCAALGTVFATSGKNSPTGQSSQRGANTSPEKEGRQAEIDMSMMDFRARMLEQRKGATPVTSQVPMAVAAQPTQTPTAAQPTQTSTAAQVTTPVPPPPVQAAKAPVPVQAAPVQAAPVQLPLPHSQPATAPSPHGLPVIATVANKVSVDIDAVKASIFQHENAAQVSLSEGKLPEAMRHLHLAQEAKAQLESLTASSVDTASTPSADEILEPTRPTEQQQKLLDDLEKYRPEAAAFVHEKVAMDGASWDEAFAQLQAYDKEASDLEEAGVSPTGVQAVQLTPGINPPDGTPMDVVGELEARRSRKEKVLLPDGRAVSALKKGELVEAHKTLLAALDGATRSDWYVVTSLACRTWATNTYNYSGKAPTVEALRKDVVLLALHAGGGDLATLADEVYSDSTDTSGESGSDGLSDSDKAPHPGEIKDAGPEGSARQIAARWGVTQEARWEYQLWASASAGVEELNTLGAQGWEAVQVQMMHSNNGVWLSGLLKKAVA